MDLVSSCPYPSTYLVWQMRPGAWILTVICKATFFLIRRESAIAPIQEPLVDEDRFLADNPASSLHCPADLVPAKTRADVVLVGHAHTPDRKPVRSVVTRLAIGGIDKAVEVTVDRVLRPDGSIAEAAPALQLLLAYERAAGGPDTANPIGLSRHARDAQGFLKLPSLYKPNEPMSWESIGYGPIAATWRDRQSRVHKVMPIRDLLAKPLGEGMDLAFFNVAPPDQQLALLEPRPTLVLEGLHSDCSKLTTELPTPILHAVFEGRRVGPVPIPLRADTLWINTDGGICTLTYRGTMVLEGANESGRILLSEEPRPKVVRPPASPAEGGAFGGSGNRLVPPPMTEELRVSALNRKAPVLPFGGRSPVAPPTPPPPARESSPVFGGYEPASPWANPGISSTPADRPGPVSDPAARPAAIPTPKAGGVLQASNLAAGCAPGAPEATPVHKTSTPPLRDSSPVLSKAIEVVDLLWFDGASVPRIRRKPPFRAILEAREDTPTEDDGDDPAVFKDPGDLEERGEVFEVLARGEPTRLGELRDVLTQCIREDGKFVPTLVLLSGDLEFPFDTLAALRATMTTVVPWSSSDKPLKNAIDAAKEFLATPDLMSSSAVAEALIRQIEEAFAQGKRGLPAGYLEAQCERVLLEQRQYQRRTVFGQKHVRASLRSEVLGKAPAPARAGSPDASAELVPTYLPDAVAGLLPLYPRCSVRLIAEVQMAVDPYETHIAALRAVALARVSAMPKAS